MVKMEIEVPENWRNFLLDFAERMKEDPSVYWGNYFVLEHLKTAMHDDNHWLTYNLQDALVEKHGITLEEE